jgi:predicted small secreted protein
MLGDFIMIKRLLALILTTLFITSIATTMIACNTVEGAGKDIEKGGKAIKDEASEHND